MHTFFLIIIYLFLFLLFSISTNSGGMLPHAVSFLYYTFLFIIYFYQILKLLLSLLFTQNILLYQCSIKKKYILFSIILYVKVVKN